MKAIILAAGRGTRLGTLTDDKPKCMLPFGNETILQRQVRILCECGIQPQDITVVIGYKGETVCTNCQTMQIINEEYKTTDNSYSLFLALSCINDTVLIIDGDLIFEKPDIQSVLNENENILLGCCASNDCGRTGIVYDNTNRVTAIGKHINSDISYASIMKINSRYLPLIIEQLNIPDYKKTWYTIPINKIISKLNFTLKAASYPIFGINTYFDYIDAKRVYGIEDFSILVTGASGFLGKKIYHILKRDFNVKGLKGRSASQDIPPVDLTKENAVKACIELLNPSVIVHTAGLADPDICEVNKELAYSINVEAVRILTAICKERNIKLVHISTDYVFDGESHDEYSYHSAAVPQTYYGETKQLAESIVAAYDNSLIVRIPVLYGYNDETDKETFPAKVVKALSDKKTLFLDHKQIRYPVLIDDVAIAIRRSMTETGMIHITSSVPVTKYTWAKTLADVYGLDGGLILEDKTCKKTNRPPHIKLKVTERDYEVSNVLSGTHIMKNQEHCAFRLIYKSEPVEYVYGKNIGHYRYNLGKALGSSLPKHIIDQLDYVIPVPSSGNYYAMGMAEAIGVPYLQGLLKPDTSTRSFQIADITLRERTIRTKISPIEELMKGKKIALVDEAIFTGTTLRVVCDMVKACQAEKIFICLPTPICRNQCKQYVQPERELLSHQLGKETFKDYFKVDGVFFQPYKNFETSLEECRDICYECFKEGECDEA